MTRGAGDAPEGLQQIDRYLALAEGKAKACGDPPYSVVYLSPRRFARASPHLISATWNDVANAIQDVLKTDGNGTFGANLLSIYVDFRSQNVIGEYKRP
jgi:hypothetical protein